MNINDDHSTKLGAWQRPWQKRKNAELSQLSLADSSDDLWHAHEMNARTQKCDIKALLKRGYSFAEITVCSY